MDVSLALGHATYLLKTGDLSFVKANFDTEGPAGKTEPSIEDTAHLIAADRTGRSKTWRRPVPASAAPARPAPQDRQQDGSWRIT